MNDDDSPISLLLEELHRAELAELRRQGIGMTHMESMLDIINNPGPDVINIRIKPVAEPKRKRPDFLPPYLRIVK
jgi:hypothetical protein